MSKTRFLCWDFYNADKEDAQVVESSSARYAAERFVEDNYADMEYPTSVTVEVLDPSTGTAAVWCVDVVAEPAFNARQLSHVDAPNVSP